MAVRHVRTFCSGSGPASSRAWIVNDTSKYEGLSPSLPKKAIEAVVSAVSFIRFSIGGCDDTDGEGRAGVLQLRPALPRKKDAA